MLDSKSFAYLKTAVSKEGISGHIKALPSKKRDLGQGHTENFSFDNFYL